MEITVKCRSFEGIKETTGTPISIERAPSLSFAVHRNVCGKTDYVKRMWMVTELSCGLAVIEAVDTRKDAIKAATDRFNRISDAAVATLVEAAKTHAL